MQPRETLLTSRCDASPRGLPFAVYLLRGKPATIEGLQERVLHVSHRRLHSVQPSLSPPAPRDVRMTSFSAAIKSEAWHLRTRRGQHWIGSEPKYDGR